MNASPESGQPDRTRKGDPGVSRERTALNPDELRALFGSKPKARMPKGRERRRRPAKTPHAGWKTNQLILALSRAGWGELAGHDARGLRAVLDAVAAKIVDHRMGRAFSTIPEIAAAAGYGHTWTQIKLTELDEIGFIDWRRGGLKPGRGHGRERSFFIVNRHALVEAIAAAKALRGPVITEHVAECIRRLREQRLKWLRARYAKRKPRSEQDPPTGSHSLRTSGESVREPSPEGASDYFKQLHASGPAPDECEHGYASALSCAWCKKQPHGAGSAGAQTMRGGAARG
jgi:hypothetical protein